MFLGQKLGFYRQFMAGQPHGFFGLGCGHAVHLKHNPAALYHSNEMVNRALAAAHRRFIAMQGYGLVRKYANPNLAAALNVAGHGAPGAFNLPGRHPRAFHGLQCEVAKGNIVARAALAFGAPAVVLSVFNFFWDQHNG